MVERSMGEDRGELLTEGRLAASSALDAMSTSEVLATIHAADLEVAGVVGGAMAELGGVVDAVVRALGGGGRLVYVGAGTSGRLGVLDASEIPPTFHLEAGRVIGVIAGGAASLVRSSEGKEDEADGAIGALGELAVGGDDVVVGIAAGGTTPYVLGGLAWSKRQGAVTGLITCVSREQATAALGDMSVDHLVCLPVGPEVVTGSTRMKAGTATKLALNMISTAAMVRLGKTWGNLMVDLRASNAKLRDRAVRIMQSQQPGLSRDAAMAAVDAAGGRVKIALVMVLRQVDAGEAEAMLAAHGGRLRPILGAPR